MGLSVIILAGGTGSRMQSKIPKVLHKLAGKPLLEHVIDTVHKLKADNIFIVYGHMGEFVKSSLEHHDVYWVEQTERLGTGHAVLQVLPYLKEDHQVLILYGDVPLITEDTLEHFIDATSDNQLGLLTALVENPSGLGRIVRDEYRQVMEIVEERDATEIQKQIKEINTGIYCAPAKLLNKWVPQLENNNAQKEYYLTDIVRFARQEHIGINVSKPKAKEEILGANTRSELAKLERIYQKWQVEKIMAQGASVLDPARVDIRGAIQVGQDCTIDVCTIFEGNVVIGDDCYIGPNCYLKDVILADGVFVDANCVIDGAVIEEGASIGPFARIRPGTLICADAKIGNFVEVKKSHIGPGSKVNHLSYVGDAQIGSAVNIGAGTITCNYDGANKHLTTIDDNAFVGSSCQLVAPVKIGKGATIGAGSTITKDVPEGHLALTRTSQKMIANWVRPAKKKTTEPVEE